MARALVNVLYIERIYVPSSNNCDQMCMYVFVWKNCEEEEEIDLFSREKITKIKFSSLFNFSRFSFIWAASNVSSVQVNSHVSWYRVRGNYAHSLVTAHCCESLYV